MNYRSLYIVLPMLMWLSVGPLSYTAAAQGHPKECDYVSAVRMAIAGGIHGVGKETRLVPYCDSRDVGWSSQVLDRDLHVYSVAFSTPMTGLVAGMNGCILRSSDGRRSWNAEISNSLSYLWGVLFTDPYNGTAVGCVFLQPACGWAEADEENAAAAVIRSRK